MAVHFDYGQYAIWFLAPEFKVSMDGRRETVYPDSVYAAALRFQNGTGRWDEVLDDHPTDIALVPRRGSTYNLLVLKPQWQLLHEDRLVGMFARSSWPGSEAVLAQEPPAIPADGAGRCFP